jgi:Mannosyltransferase (PIG-V)
MKRAPVRDILWLFSGTRAMLLIITYFSYILFTAPNYTNTPVDVVALFSSWEHWDAARYVSIAQFGYQNRYDLAFFPLFPLLIWPLGHLSGNYLLPATLISNFALLGALFLLYQMATEAGGEQVGRRTLLYLCIFPTAFFFFAAYNESLFLLLTLGTFMAMRRQVWWLAGVLGFLAALTRSIGVLLVLPCLYELWLSRESFMASRQRFILKALPIVLIPLGSLLYCIFCWKVSGDFLAFASVQVRWARHTSWPWYGLFLALVQLFWLQPFGSFSQAHIILDLSATLGFMLLAFLGRRKLRPSYTLWIGILMLFYLLSPATTQSDSLQSNQRFVLEMFPGFITLAMLGINHPRLHQAIMLFFPALQATLSILFVMNRWMV